MERKVQIMQLTLFGQTFFCFVEDKLNLASKSPNAKNPILYRCHLVFVNARPFIGGFDPVSSVAFNRAHGTQLCDIIKTSDFCVWNFDLVAKWLHTFRFSFNYVGYIIRGHF